MDSKCQVLQSWWLQTLKEWKINWFADPKRVELMLNKNQKSEEQIEFFIPLTKEGDKEPDRRQKKDLQKLQGTLLILTFLELFGCSFKLDFLF